MAGVGTKETRQNRDFSRFFHGGCLALIVLMALWSPFPLGSNRDWSWSILCLLTALTWLFWSFWAWTDVDEQISNLKIVAIPLALVAVTLVWAAIQTMPSVPRNWAHPVWLDAETVLSRPLDATISLNPWGTAAELTKLACYVAIAWITFCLARNSRSAQLLLNALVVVGTGYALYAFILAIAGKQQFSFFYTTPAPDFLLSGPFVQRNNFATYEGMIFLASFARLMNEADDHIVSSKGRRLLLRSVMKFMSGVGGFLLLATILSASALVATGSRGGVLATFCGLGAMAALYSVRARRKRRKINLAGVGGALLLLLLLFVVSGAIVSGRFEQLFYAGSIRDARIPLWHAAERMIASAPVTGLGLGTFQDAYPLYATGILPFIMDKAHNDYLEFAAGIGLPAAFCWWAAIVYMAGLAARGAVVRRKNVAYPIIGFGVTILIGAHSVVDFSLQIPAVAATFAMFLGITAAQSLSSATTRKSSHAAFHDTSASRSAVGRSERARVSREAS
jgi:O-antigen ligase